MLLPLLRSTLTRITSIAAPPVLRNAPLLTPINVTFTPACTFKIKGHVRRRCNDCFLVVREGRLYNICKTHPRHKQMQMQKAEKRTWVLTHATQGKIRPW